MTTPYGILADKIEAELEKGTPSMQSLGGIRKPMDAVVIDMARQLDSVVTGMHGVILALRQLDADAAAQPMPAAPILADDRVERAAQMISYAVSPDTMGDTVAVWWSSVEPLEKERLRKLARNVLDGTVNPT